MFALDLLNQFQSYNGTLLAAGKIYVYHLGRTNLASVYGDHNGATVLPNPVILDDQGMAEIYLNDAFNYTVVVCDAYGAEQFSRDVYPKGMGNGESIGTQLYEGIDPICVNNDLYTISANTSRLGVTEPLYFVRDDEEETIIGMSAIAVPSGTMNESAFSYQDDKITAYNGSAFSAGNEYEAGNYVSIDNNTINVTGLQPAGDYQSAGNYVSANELENLQPKGDYYSASNPSGFLIDEDITGKLNTTAFSTVSGDFLTAVPPEYVTENILQSGLSSKLDSTAFSTVSGDFLTAVPEGYATEDWVTAQGYLTAETDWTDTITAASANAYEQATAAIPVPFDPTYISGQIDSKLDSATYAADSGNFATTGDINDLVTSIAETYQPKLSFEYNEDSAISAINGSALAGGGLTGDYVSGVNTVYVQPHEWDPVHRYEYTTIISGDVQVKTAEWFNDQQAHSGLYSLSAIGNEIGNKLNSDYVTNSNTIKNINSHAEMADSAYRPNGFDIMSAEFISINPSYTTVSFNSHAYGHEGWLYSAIVIAETNTTGYIQSQGWTLQSFEDGSAVLVKKYNAFDKAYNDSVYLVNDWNVTNLEASAMTYSALELVPIAFKDDITGITYTTGSI